MAKRNSITEAEWPIMAVLWEKGTATSAEIIDAILADRDASRRTLKALLNRLVTKGSVIFTRDENDQRVYHYRPAITREEAVRGKTRAFLGMLGGDVMNLLTNFVSQAELTDDDIEQLRELLRKKEEKEQS